MTTPGFPSSSSPCSGAYRCSGLPAATVDELAHHLVPLSFSPGAELVREGETGDCYYAIASGTVEIRQGRKLVALLHRGEGLGEIALLNSGPRTATAVALSPRDSVRPRT